MWSMFICVSSESAPHLQRRVQQRVPGVRHRNVSYWEETCAQSQTSCMRLQQAGRRLSDFTSVWGKGYKKAVVTAYCDFPLFFQVHSKGTGWLADPQQCSGAHIWAQFAHWGETFWSIHENCHYSPPPPPQFAHLSVCVSVCVCFADH